MGQVGKRYPDGSSGTMVSNIRHSTPNVLDAMRQQMEKSTYGYRLHFETNAAEALAISGYTPLTAPFAPMMQMMPKVPVPRVCLFGLNLEDPVTGQHYADMLDAKIQAEGTESVLTFSAEPTIAPT